MARRVLRPGESIQEARIRWKIERQREIVSRQNVELLDIRNKKTEAGRARLRKDRQILRAKLSAEKRLALLMEKMPEPLPYAPGYKKLSGLICSLKDRDVLLQKLVKELKGQSINNTDDVEILVAVDNKEITTGAKRNILLKRASGDYICFVDDDDTVSNDYIKKILRAIKSNPDCCSLTGQIRRMAKQKGRRRILTNTFIHSLQYKDWFEKNGIYYRCPNHLNTVKRELAMQVGFPDVVVEEDRAYSLKLYPLLKTETVIKDIIYFYEK